MGPLPLLRALRGLYSRLGRGTRCAIWVALGTPTILVASAALAYAGAGTLAPGALSWIKINDSHGINIWQYQLSLDGGGITDSGKAIWSFLVQLVWGLYVTAVAMAIWFIDWALSFAWLDVVVTPVESIGEALTIVVARFGVGPTLLTIAAVAAVLWMAKGKWVLGIFELFLSLIIASLAVGVLSNPVRLVAGSDGLLYGSRDLGLEISSGLANDGETDKSPEEARKQLTAMLADTFIRQPAQVVNFGVVLDGGKCEDAYTKVVKAGPYGDGDEIRNAVSDCDSAYGDVAENPNVGMAMSAIALSPAAAITMIFAALLAGSVVVAGLYALFNSLKLIVTLLFGLLPGSARGTLWMTIADLAISLVTLVFSVVFLGAFLLLIQAVFATGTEETRMQTFFIVDVLLLAGMIVYWKYRKSLKAAAERLAQSLAKRPGGGSPTALPKRSTFNPTEAYYKGRMAVGGAQMAGRGAMAASNATAAVPYYTGRGAGKAGRAAVTGIRSIRNRKSATATEPAPDSAPDSRPTVGGNATVPALTSGSATRVLERVQGTKSRTRATAGLLLRAGTTVAAAAATGGTSTVAQTAGKKVATRALGATARRAALTSRLRPGPSPSGSQTPKQPGGQTPERAKAQDASGRGEGYDRVVVGGQVALVPRNRPQPTQKPRPRASGARQDRLPPPPPSPSPSAASSTPVGGRSTANQKGPSNGTLRRPAPTNPASTTSQPAAVPLPGPAPASHTSGAEQDDAARRLRARLEARRTPPALRRRPGSPVRPGSTKE